MSGPILGSGQLFIGKADATPGDPSGWTELGFADFDGIVNNVEVSGDDEPLPPLKTSWTAEFDAVFSSDAMQLLVEQRLGMAVLPPRHSVTIDQVEFSIRAEPCARPGWRRYWDRLVRRHRYTETRHLIRTFIPRAIITASVA